MESFTGEIAFFAFPGAPVGWLPCDGRLLAVNSYKTLFSVLGINYGGNGTTTFALPTIPNTLTYPTLCVGWCICVLGDTYPNTQ